ncbi:MAG: RNA polymerase sigma factor [Isosphaeraceae bacterium]
MSDQGPNSSKILVDLAEKQVMAAVMEDRPGAFEKLVELYQKRIYQFIFHMVKNREEAEDLTQELFLRVFRARHKYRPEARLSKWIFMIAHNLALNSIRSRKSRKGQMGRGLAGAGTTTHMLAPELNVVSPEGTPSAQMRSVELSQVVQESIFMLAEDQRVAIMLNKYEEMSYEEIAQIMGRTEASVKSLLFRARVNLKDHLEAYLNKGVRPPQQGQDG